MQARVVESFEQAVIKVDKEREFEELKSVVIRVFAPEKVEAFLGQLKKHSLRVRDWDSLLAKGMLEGVDKSLARSRKTAQELYDSLTLSDKAQIREFYLFRVEDVEPKLRARFHKIYQYY
jgi:hypothetical protein